MSKRLKTLGMALVGVMAITALVAASAQAATAKFMAESYPASITAEQVGEHVFQIESELKVKCKKATFSTEATAETSELSVTPTYSECTAFGLAASVNMRGCKYTLKSGETTAEADVYKGSAVVTCGSEKILIKTNNGVCEVEVGAQTPGGSVTYKNNTGASPKTINIEPNVSGIQYTKTKDGSGCPLNGTGTKEDGTYTGNTLATSSTGITLTP